MASNFDSDKYLREDWKAAKEGNSTHYDRLGLDPGRPYTPAQVDEAYLPRYLWWKEREKQKTSGRNNPLIREVGDHIKTALENLLIAKNCLSDAEKKCVYDNEILAKLAQEKEEPFLKYVAGALLDHELSQKEKAGLFERARELGITRERAQILIWEQLKETGSREVDEPTSTGSGEEAEGGRRKPVSDPPELIIKQTNFSLGTLRRGDKREAIFTIDNRGGGSLQGHFTTSHPHWLHVFPSAIIESRHHQEVKVTVDTSKLALGAKYSGTVKVHSNGGTQTVAVEFSIEVEKDALARFRQVLFWLGFCGGGLIGYFFYHFLIAAPSRDVITGIAGLLGIVAAVVVGGRSAGFGGGCAGLILSLIILGVLQKTWPEGFSTFSWAITYGTYLHAVSRPLFISRQTRKVGPVLGLAAGCIMLFIGVLVCAHYFGSRSADKSDAMLAPAGTSILLDELTHSSVGRTQGITWIDGIGDHGAVFRAANSSRIEYPGKIPREGTIELWIKVDSGYEYHNYAFTGNLDHAMIFSTDAEGGDVTWPGTTKLFVYGNGRVSLFIANNKYNQPPTSQLEAQGSSFRFHKWHAIGFSAGNLGQFVMVDGIVVAADRIRIQQIGCAGTHASPADIPTVGETVSHFWRRHQHEGGFEGIVARFRASPKQLDWDLARGIARSYGSAPEPKLILPGGPPNGVAAPASNSPRLGGGMGSGSAGGVGSGNGGGLGPGEGGGVGGGVYSVGGGVSAPIPIYKPEPAYSEEARKAKYQGTVRLFIVVDASGAVTICRVIKPLGLGLDEKAVETVKTWKFKPALKNGTPVPVQVTVEVSFRLF